jgi:transcriptional regulator with XRE-family HTH domain
MAGLPTGGDDTVGQVAREPSVATSREFDGRVLKVLLDATGMRHEDLSRRTGINSRMISRIARGRRALDRATVESLAAGLGLPPRAFAETSSFLAYLDHLAHLDLLRSRGRLATEPREQSPRSVPEDAGRTVQELEQFLEDERLAADHARSDYEIVLRLLSGARDSSF